MRGNSQLCQSSGQRTISRRAESKNSADELAHDWAGSFLHNRKALIDARRAKIKSVKDSDLKRTQRELCSIDDPLFTRNLNLNGILREMESSLTLPEYRRGFAYQVRWN